MFLGRPVHGHEDQSERPLYLAVAMDFQRFEHV